MKRAFYAVVFTILSTLSCVTLAFAYPGTYFVSGFGSGYANYRADAVMIARDNAESNMERTCNNYANSYSGEAAYLSEVRTSNISAYESGSSWSASVSVSGKCVVIRT